MNKTNELINLKNVGFAYLQNVVLNNVSLQINEGDFVGIVGKNGSGKSTLIKLILSELKPTSGKATINKTKTIGYVEQVSLVSDNSFPANVQEIVLLGLYKKIGLFKFANKEHKLLVSQALEMVKMQDCQKQQISFLSGGQQQKVLIAKALVSNPDVLILDEPTTGIDAESEKDFFKMLTHLNKFHKKTIILVTHNLAKLTNTNKVFKIENQSVELVQNV